MEELKHPRTVDSEESTESTGTLPEPAERCGGTERFAGSAEAQRHSDDADEESQKADLGDNYQFFNSMGERLDGSKSLSLEILGEAGLKSAGRGRLRIDYTGALQDMLRKIGIFPICVMAFSMIGFLLYRFPANAGEWWIFQWLTMPSIVWLAAWRLVESWYVVDVAHQRIDYRLQVGGQGMEFGALDRDELLGVTLSGQLTVNGWEYAVVAGLKNGKLVRLSDFSADFAMMGRQAGVLSRLLEVPLVDGRPEAFAEIQPNLETGVLELTQVSGLGPTLSGGGCTLALELFFVPAFAAGFGWLWGPLAVLSYFWGRYWWIK